MALSTTSRLRRYSLTTLLAGSILISGGAALAQTSDSTPTADTSSTTMSESESTTWTADASVSPADAVATASAESSGQLLGFGIGDSEGEPAYFFQFDDQMVTVSAVSGDVLDTQAIEASGRRGMPGNMSGPGRMGTEMSSVQVDANESETGSSDEDSGTSVEVEAEDSEPNELEMALMDVTVSPVDAISTAEEATGEEVHSFDLRMRGETIVYVTWSDNSEVKIDAATGEVRETTIRTVYISDESEFNETETGTPES